MHIKWVNTFGFGLKTQNTENMENVLKEIADGSLNSSNFQTITAITLEIGKSYKTNLPHTVSASSLLSVHSSCPSQTHVMGIHSGIPFEQLNASSLQTNPYFR